MAKQIKDYSNRELLELQQNLKNKKELVDNELDIRQQQLTKQLQSKNLKKMVDEEQALEYKIASTIDSSVKSDYEILQLVDSYPSGKDFITINLINDKELATYMDNKDVKTYYKLLEQIDAQKATIASNNPELTTKLILSSNIKKFMKTLGTANDRDVNTTQELNSKLKQYTNYSTKMIPVN